MSPGATSNVLTVLGLLVLIVVVIGTLVAAFRARSWSVRIYILIVVPVTGAIVLWWIVVAVSGLNGP